MTTYEQLEKIVLPTLGSYKEDLTKHDKRILSEYNGKFLYGWRKSGTNMIKLADDYKEYFKADYLEIWEEKKLLKAYKEEIIWITHLDGKEPINNKGMLFFDGSKLKKITREQALTIHKEHIERIIHQYQQSKKPAEIYNF